MAPLSVLLLALPACSTTLGSLPRLALRPMGVAASALAVPAAPLAPLAAASALPALSPSLSPALAPAFAAPAGSPRPADGGPSAGAGAHPAQAALAARAAEFARLIDEVMGEDRARAEAAALQLRGLKEEHLNPAPDPKRAGVLELKPMQIPAGMISVHDKVGQQRGLGKKDSDEWLKENSVPVLVDYKGRKRPVDHHHEARAVWEAGGEHVYTHHYLDDELHGLMKALPKARFYAAAKAMGLWYDRDQFGAGPHGPDHLPEDVRSMADDPYRSVAWKVRRLGGFQKSAGPFAEFYWANYFRERLATYPTAADFDASVREAMAIVHDPAARALPGWSPR